MRTKAELRTGVWCDLRQIIAETHLYESCITCRRFDEKNEICKLVNQRPPARVIAFGCPRYDDQDEIPF